MMVYVVLMSNEMENFVDFILKHWEGLASLLLSAVSIGIAICSARSTSKDASRQIASIKRLCLSQIDAQLLQLEIEIFKAQKEEINAREEITMLQKELEDLKNNPDVTGKEITKFQHKLQTLGKNANMQRAWAFKLFNTQANLVFASRRIKEEKV